MDDLDKTLRDFIKKHHPLYDSGEGEDCLSEEQFAEYLNNLMDAPKKEEAEKHLEKCEDCFQKSIVFSRVINEMESKGLTDVPKDIIEKAKIPVSALPSKDMIEVVLEFGKGIINIIKDTADICRVPEPAAPGVRNGGGTGKGPAVAQISKEFDGIKADISVEKLNEAECEIEAKISEPSSGELLDDIRVNLISGKKELASYLTIRGYVSFKNLKFGKYILRIHKGKNPIGSLKLKLSPIQ
jgi:hypothetical protein